jgi:hypothetical protein
MQKLIARIKAFFVNPKNDVKSILPQIEALKKDMERIQLMPNKVEAIIELFRVISPLQDKGGFEQTIFKLQAKNYGQIDQAINALNTLQTHFRNAGRCESGLNRTKPGEQVHASNVYLGDVWGIWTKPAAYWLQNQEKLERQDSGAPPKEGCEREFISTWYCINDYQAGSFVRSHVDGILEQIGILKKSFA